MAGSGKLTVRYTGPAQQVCYALAEHGYSAILNRETLYELPVELAESLLASNKNFVRAEGYIPPPVVETSPARWRFPERATTATTATSSGTNVTFTSSSFSGPDPEQNQGE